MSQPTDPNFGSQLQFTLIGDIQAIWDDYTGAGISAGVFDDGVQSTHSDLSANYDASLHFSHLGSTYDATPGTGDNHGTAVAGVIGATGNNGVGGVGVAYGASITGVDLYTDVWGNNSAGFNSDADGNGISDGQTAAFAHMAAFDVVNNSWGVSQSSLFTNGISLMNPYGFDSVYADTIAQHVSAGGRGGLGTSVVKSAGNNGSNSNGEGLDASPHTIVVAATNSTGTVASYSDWGSNVLLAAPAVNYTTDLMGSTGYTSSDFTTFGGTSAAAPVVSGVIALMLDANEGLGWRDVQEILGMSAGQTGSTFGSGPTGYEQGSWASNGAETWNGGGLSYHLSFGFGMVDAYAAVRMAEAWSLFQDTAKTSGNMQVIEVNDGVGTTTIQQAQGGSNGITEIEFSVSQDIDLQNASLQINMQHARSQELELTLVSPDGNEHRLMEVGDGNASTMSNGFNWEFGIVSVLGAASVGTWTLRIEDTANAGAENGRVFDANLILRGDQASQDTVHHFTADFLELSQVEAGRTSISDTDGGEDWLNLSAIAQDIQLDLSTAGSLQVGGVHWANLGGDEFENTVSGDGNDHLQGNLADNHLVGMRGDDTLIGMGGKDLIEGGAGADILEGGDGQDRLLGGDGNDSIRGGADADVIEGGAGGDSLRGDFGVDLIRGGSGHDWLYGNGDRDRLFGDGGVDRLRGGDGNDRLYGGDGNDTLIGETGRDFLDGGRGRDKLFGGANDDVLTGGADDDTLTGGSGRDTFIFRPLMGTDTVTDFDLAKDNLKVDLDLTGAQSTPADVVSAFGSIQSGDAVLDFGGGNQIVLAGLNTLSGLDGAIELF